MTHTTQAYKKGIEKFRKEYHIAYDGILPPEVVEKGNPWFENYLHSFALSLLEAQKKDSKDIEIGESDTLDEQSKFYFKGYTDALEITRIRNDKTIKEITTEV